MVISYLSDVTIFRHAHGSLSSPVRATMPRSFALPVCARYHLSTYPHSRSVVVAVGGQGPLKYGPNIVGDQNPLKRSPLSVIFSQKAPLFITDYSLIVKSVRLFVAHLEKDDKMLTYTVRGTSIKGKKSRRYAGWQKR